MADLNVSALADVIWLLALAAMALQSRAAWKTLPEEGWTPMQWGPDGEPTASASRDLAVAFTPMAAALGGLLLAAAARMAGDEPGLGLTAVRFAAPVLLALAHRWHLQAAVATVRAAP
jgi:hypothetical protein